MKKSFFLLFLGLLVTLATNARQFDDISPPMGWNSWNWWGKQQINEQVVRDTIDAMVEKGLQQAGYNYIVVDGGWRDNHLAEDGRLKVHKGKFPSGIKALADYAHAKGFKFGLHTSPGTHDCGADPIGSWGVEDIHVEQFIEWGLDFVKLDKCQFWLREKPAPSPSSREARRAGWAVGENAKHAYARWRTLMNKSPRPMVLSASAYEFFDWYPRYTQMGRTTLDIACRITGGAKFDEKPKRHLSVMEIAELNNQYAEFAGKGYWNDPDMLVTGDQGLNLAEQKSHFALWSIMTSPLMLGSDPVTMGSDELAIVTNKTAIAINQDTTEQGRRLSQKGSSEVWAKKLANGKVAVLLLNRDRVKPQSMSVTFKDIGLKGKQPVLDIYADQPLGVSKKQYQATVAPGESLFVLIGK